VGEEKVAVTAGVLRAWRRLILWEL